MHGAAGFRSRVLGRVAAPGDMGRGRCRSHDGKGAARGHTSCPSSRCEGWDLSSTPSGGALAWEEVQCTGSAEVTSWLTQLSRCMSRGECPPLQNGGGSESTEPNKIKPLQVLAHVWGGTGRLRSPGALCALTPSRSSAMSAE